jgi:undecaprenyl diphosphate synthase
MTLFERAFAEDFAALERDGCRLRFIGDLGRLPEKLRALAAAMEQRTAGGTAGTLAVALSYGGRAEIVAAANKLIAEGKGPATEDSFRAALWSADLPNPDLIIRTGKEKRLSNFLTFQSAYSELFFEDEHWPDFTPAHLDRVFDEYAARERRRGR